MSIQAMTFAWSTPLSGSAKLVLLKLAWHADAFGGNAWPSVATIAADCGLSSRQVQRCLRQLQRDGLIYVQRRGGQHRPPAYKILLPSSGVTLSPLEHSSGVTSAAPQGRHSAPSRGDISALRGDTGVTRTVPRTVPFQPPEEPSLPQPPPAGGRGPAQRAREGSRRKRDVAALHAEDGDNARYFTGRFGEILRQREEQRRRAR